MTTNRRDERAGWLRDHERLTHCRCGCGKPVPPERRTFATPECVHEWRIRTSPRYCRDQVALRDKGVCAICGVDAERLQRRTNRILRRARDSFREDVEERGKRRVWEILLARDWVAPADAHQRLWRAPAWAADHIVPVKLGGGACGLENLQTLCRPCHLAKTRLDRAAIKEAKRRGREAERVREPVGPRVEGQSEAPAGAGVGRDEAAVDRVAAVEGAESSEGVES